MSPASDHHIELSFEDNRRLPLLYGEHNVNLARIEKQLGVKLAARGNILKIVGPSASAETARSVLSDLWRQTSINAALGPAEIDAALRLKSSSETVSSETQAVPVIRTRKRTIAARTPTQGVYLRAMEQTELVIGAGPAGTGKTYLAVAQAVAALQSGQVDRIIISRPAVEAGERLGFLPGDLREKVDPYLRPIYDALDDLLSPEQVERRMTAGEIEIAPLAFMRGRTLAHCFVILDEAQNTTVMQMKMALTRIGEGSRMVVNGDPGQIDLPGGIRSGLIDAIETLQGVEGVAIVEFTDNDVVRHPLVARIIRGLCQGRSDADKIGDEMSVPNLRIILEVEDPRWTAALPDASHLLDKAIGLALTDIDTGARTIEVGVRLVDDDTIHGLNRDWRGRDKPTNVLSFPLGDPGIVADADFPWLIGDIVMSYDTVAAESRRDAKSLAHHFMHLAIHATLHLTGHDHEEDAEAEKMECAEIALLAELGIADPYIPNTLPDGGSP